MGDYIALKCEHYKGCLPQVAQLTNVNDTEIEFNWLNGTYSGLWAFWKSKRKVVSEALPRRALIRKVELSSSMRLANALKEIYNDAEFV